MMLELAGVTGPLCHCTLCVPPLKVHVTLPPFPMLPTVEEFGEYAIPGPTVTAAVCATLSPNEVNTMGDPESEAIAVSAWAPREPPSVRVIDTSPVPSLMGHALETEPPPVPTAH